MSGKTVTTINYGIIRNTTLPGITICPHYLDYRKLAKSNENVSILYKRYLKLIQNSSRKDIEDNFSIYLKALKIFFDLNSSNININNTILVNLTPYQIYQKNITTLDVKLYSVSAYGKIENDLIQMDEHSYGIISLPMESLTISLYNNIPFVYKCYTLFSHSHSSWNNIYMDFKDI